MRLLQRLSNGSFKLVSFADDAIPPYAILSHTWIDGQEVTYHELVAGTRTDKAGYKKIGFCTERAAVNGLDYSWIDTCCIDKSDVQELSTAINSMFRWYQRANRCYVYLSDVSVPDEVIDAQAFLITWLDAFRRSRWFTRGWTLQELLAPATVEFFSRERKHLGSKITLEQEIHKITKIPIEVLRGQSLANFSVKQRMDWAAKRTTTWEEDKVYCLLGVFGVFLPLIYGEGKANAALRLQEEIEKRQKGQGTESLRDIPVSSSLPFPRNELFIGREDQLQFLHQHFFVSSTHRRMTIYGLGGCGKSALAIEFAYHALATDASHMVFWVPAISQESFERAYQEIGACLHIPGIMDDNTNIKQLVKEALTLDSGRNWLMIVDNTDDPRVLMQSPSDDLGEIRLYDYLPHTARGKILFTTRSRKMAGLLTPGNVLDLPDMSSVEARKLLAHQTTKPALLNDGKAVDELLNSLEHLPLAIMQAAAFIDINDVSVSEYVSLLQQRETAADLFGQHFEDANRYREMESTIAKTWHISFDQIRQQDPLAAEYLSFMACIDRISIPQSILPLNGTMVQQVKAIGTLKGYTFVTERQQALQGQGGERFFDMHRLVHLASGWWLAGHCEQSAWVDKARERLEELIPYGGHERKEVWSTYLSHASHVTSLAGHIDDEARASLLERVGRCQSTLGYYSAAVVVHQQALALRTVRLGREHRDTLTSMSNLAGVLNSQGKYEEAEGMNRQTLARWEKVLGPDHPDTLTSMGNLALVLDSQGKYEEAEGMNRQTLARWEKVLGPDHPDTLISMNNLAGVLGRQGKYEEAEGMNRQTLARREKVLGPDHPDTLMSMSNLALVLNRQGKYEEAEGMNRQTLARREKVLGPDHPDTLMSMSNLAGVLGRQGKYEEAEGMNRQTLARREKVLGPDHPDTLKSMGNLALVLNSQGKYEEAEGMNRQTLNGSERVLGPDHPDTLTSMGNLALVLDSQGKYEEAEEMNRQTLARREKVLGPDHPDTLTSMGNLALVLDSQGKYEKAEGMNRQTLARREKVLGPDHPDTLKSMSNLALVLNRQGKYEKAEGMNRQTLARREKVLRPDHPDTLTSMNNLAGVLNSQGKYEEAEEMNRQTLNGSERVLGPDHPDTLTSMSNLAGVLDSQGKYEEAEGMNRQTLARWEKVLGPDHPDTLTSMSNLVLVLNRQGKYEEAEEMNRQTLARREKVLGPDHPDTLISMNNLAGVLDSQGKYEEAEEMNRQTLARWEKVLGPDHLNTLTSVYCLAHLLAKRHRSAESTVLYERASAGFDTVLGSNHPTTIACRQHYSEMSMSLKQDDPPGLEMTDGRESVHRGKTSKLSRTLAKIGIRSSKFSVK